MQILFTGTGARDSVLLPNSQEMRQSCLNCGLEDCPFHSHHPLGCFCAHAPGLVTVSEGPLFHQPHFHP